MRNPHEPPLATVNETVKGSAKVAILYINDLIAFALPAYAIKQ
jgi:hypothetical protein